ncbi:DUF1206 domain-containing protein [Streptomyces sp. SID13031]|uniref:DUF1206 domain-containing protein n=1 Tax=Streptomyces sp. SID13031 TaxID=2706046 RepID=UPI0013CA3C67|nr:DUF1206 domain-containing protein [Streptomyces sp. SID13031]NEA30912.1 DUF1206 domain-containing protein [Streptomyces sp. SID13031]
MRTAQKARQSRLYDVAITVGLIAYGVVHLLIAWIALQLALGKSSGETDQQGALQELASKPFGGFLLWVVAVGLLALVIWKVLELVYGHLDTEKKVSSVGRGVIYLALSISAAKVAMGSTESSSSKQSGLTAKLMESGPGRVLIVIVGLVIVGVGIRQLYKSVTKKFLEDLTGGVSDSTVLLGRLGYAAKGVAFVIVGALFAWASISYDREKAGGLDTALHTIRDQPFGSVLLTLMALGIACFGVYCFVWSRNAKH